MQALHTANRSKLEAFARCVMQDTDAVSKDHLIAIRIYAQVARILRRAGTLASNVLQENTEQAREPTLFHCA